MTIAVRPVGLAIILSAAGLAQACGGQQAGALQTSSETGPKPAAATQVYVPSSTFQEVMDSIVDPAGDYVWGAVSYSATMTSTVDRKPRTDDDWHELRRHAVALVEAANLISVPGRKVSNTNKMVEGGTPLDVDAIQKRLDSQHDALVGFAGNLRGIGLKIVDASDRHDVDAITDLGGTLDQVCEDCHRAFWYPDEPPPPGGPAPDQPGAAAKK